MRRFRSPLLASAFLALLVGRVGAGDAVDPAVRSLLESVRWADRLQGLERLEGVGTDPAVEKAVLPLLGDRDWEVQVRAAQTIARVGGESSEDALVRLALEGEIQWVRDAAVEALAALRPPGAAERLLRRVRTAREDHAKVRALRAAGALAGADLVGKFREWSRHGDERVSAEAVRAVGRIVRDPAAREDGLKILADALDERGERQHFFAYAAAVEALAALDAPEAPAHLVEEALRQPDSDPYALARIGRGLAAAPAEGRAVALRRGIEEAKKPDALARLSRLIGESRATDLRADAEGLLAHRDARVRSATARTLGLLGDAASAAPLERGLDDPEEKVRIEVVTALARVLPPAGFRALADRIRRDPSPEPRVQFVAELNDAGDPEAIPVLASFVSDEEWRVATAAIAAVGTLGIGSDLPLLEPLREHRSWKVRAAAFEAMGRLRAKEAIPLLAHGLGDKDPVVQGVCQANLQILTRQRLGTKPDRWQRWYEDHGSDLVLVKRSRRTTEERAAEKAEEEATRYAHERERLYAKRKRGIEILQKARIIVVTGAWDHVEKVLDHLSIGHTLLRAQELKESGLNPNQVVLVNCEGNLDKESQDRLRWFVNTGGYLMTTDWALTKTVTPCFPGFVQQFSGSSTGNDAVVVEEARPGHPWTDGVFDGVPALKWWLEIQAFPITVTWPERCEVIVDSAAMRQRYGSSTMAVAFRWGLGKVQHSISHFYLQEEGLAQATDPRSRMVFAADHLGIPYSEIRRLAEAGRWDGQLDDDAMKEIAPEYSMFRLIVNVVGEKSAWVENL